MRSRSSGTMDTSFYTDVWDVGPDESASFPSKWLSAHGQSAWLVFSGNDSFQRGARLLYSSPNRTRAIWVMPCFVRSGAESLASKEQTL